MSDVLEPELLGCFFDGGFSPPLAAMHLHWLSDRYRRHQVWRLPVGLRIVGPAPQRFGITICRVAADEYDVSLVWDEARLRWHAVSGQVLIASALQPLLLALGTDLNYLLEQPISADRHSLARTAA